MTNPVVTSLGGPDLGKRLKAASRARRAVIVSGTNTSDLFFDGEQFVRLTKLVTDCHATEKRVAIRCSSEGIRQDPVEPRLALPLQLPSVDTPLGQALRDLRGQLSDLAPQYSAVVVLDFADLALPQVQSGAAPIPDQQILIETLVSFPIDPTLQRHRLVVIARADGLDARLARFPGWEVVRVDLPDERHRILMAERIVERHRQSPHESAGLEPGLSPREFGRASGGLTNDDLMRAAVEAAEIGEPVTRRWVQRMKVARLQQRNVDGLDVYPPGRGLEGVAGLPQVRLFIRERQESDMWPRSIVLAGPPGVGKTLVVRAIADELGWPAVALGNVRSMWQGETERIMRGVLATVRAMAPLVVHIDEVDQVLGQRDAGPSTDGGTGARILAELWTFLGETNPDLRVLFVLTTNRSDLLDPATKSRSEIIPILHPTPSEQAELLRLACETIGKSITTDLAAECLENAGLSIVSGRMLVRIAHRAAMNASLVKADMLTSQHLAEAAGELLERADDIDDERMALKALSLATFRRYLPWVAAELLGQSVEMLPYVTPLLDQVGGLDRDRLAGRVADLDEAARRRQSSRA